MSTDEQVENLYKSFHPEIRYDIFTQARLTHIALSEEGCYFNNPEGLAGKLEVSRSQIYKLCEIHEAGVLPELKLYLMENDYSANTVYNLSRKSRGEQMEWLRVRGGYDTSKQKGNEDE